MEWKNKEDVYDDDDYTDEDKAMMAAVDPHTRPHEYQWHGLARRVASPDTFIKREAEGGLAVTHADNWRLELDDAASDEANEGDASRGVDDAAALKSTAAVQHQRRVVEVLKAWATHPRTPPAQRTALLAFAHSVTVQAMVHPRYERTKGVKDEDGEVSME
jgi:hypothetical protein